MTFRRSKLFLKDMVDAASIFRIGQFLLGFIPSVPNVYGELSTHLLDVSRGLPAVGVSIQLVALSTDGSPRLLREAVSNEEGHTDAPLVGGTPIPIGCYEPRFSLGRCLAHHSSSRGPAFLDIVPLRFHIAEPEAHYHIPLLFTPWSYSTYRGS